MGQALKTDETRSEIRKLLRMRMRPEEIYGPTGYFARNRKRSMARSTFYYHLKQIRKEDQKYVDEMASQNFASVWRVTLESLEDQIKELIDIRENAEEPRDKIDATKAIMELEREIFNVAAYGPTVMEMRKRKSRPTTTDQHYDPNTVKEAAAQR